MMTKNKIAGFLVAAMLVSGLAIAADAPKPPKDVTPVPDGAPKAGDISEPEITIRSRGTVRTEEYRLNGKLYMIRIVPPKGRPYFLIDQTGRGQFVRHDGPVAPSAVPQWVVKTF